MSVEAPQKKYFSSFCFAPNLPSQKIGVISSIVAIIFGSLVLLGKMYPNGCLGLLGYTFGLYGGLGFIGLGLIISCVLCACHSKQPQKNVQLGESFIRKKTPSELALIQLWQKGLKEAVEQSNQDNHCKAYDDYRETFGKVDASNEVKSELFSIAMSHGVPDPRVEELKNFFEKAISDNLPEDYFRKLKSTALWGCSEDQRHYVTSYISNLQKEWDIEKLKSIIKEEYQLAKQNNNISDFDFLEDFMRQDINEAQLPDWEAYIMELKKT